MLRFAKIFGVAGVVFLAIDMIWLVFIARKFYAEHLGQWMGDTKIVPALIFYIIFVLGMVVFVIEPSLQKNNIWHTLLTGAFFGLVCYATYDLTNMATLKDWPLVVTVVDLIWGAFVSATTAAITVMIVGWLDKV